ncbi:MULTISPECIES: urease accessory protein UreF [Aminobacter]|uniref:urease accessory protein UreF n=1 Tax=Aminobacter TaxID=31988 RepID=UPI0009E9E3F9|nr:MULTISPECIES: urease accessory UreF family protein [Aminobacter]MDR7225147.1 urease accessory protein [Aminobacter aminovorans]WMC96065.1 urease accessory UreF family protein [Aminobacter aminovorans]
MNETLAGRAIDASFLMALQLADSSLPIGRYVHSSGLEGILEELPKNSAQIAEVVKAVLLHGAGRCDAVAAAHAHRMFSVGDLDQLHYVDERLLATKLSVPARNASTSCGRQLAKLALQVWPHQVLGSFCHEVQLREAGNLAVVAAAVSASRGMGIENTLLAELRGTASSLFSAAVRLGRMGSAEAQVHLCQCVPIIVQAAEKALALDLDDMSSTTLELEIAMLQLQRNPLRLFAT